MDLTSMGRQELLDALVAARDCGQDGVCATPPGCQRHWEERCRELLRERDVYLANLSATQARCTELLQEAREARAMFCASRDVPCIGAGHDNDIAALAAVLWRIQCARGKHPKNTELQFTRALGEEVGEVMRALQDGKVDEAKDELIDVACVAVRWFVEGFGEVKAE